MDSAARMAELADKENLRDGLNIHTTDSLHAYEEGINHLALMARWFYGDPIYLERCMESARNMEKLTILTEDGRRHFRDRDRMGAEGIEQPLRPRIDGHANPLMWHTALQVADYNRNGRALNILCEWADTWLGYMEPGRWATDVKYSPAKWSSFRKIGLFMAATGHKRRRSLGSTGLPAMRITSNHSFITTEAAQHPYLPTDFLEMYTPLAVLLS